MRSRIVGLTLLVSLLAITLFGLPLTVGVRQYVLAYERSELERIADAAALMVSADLLRGTRPPQPATPRPGVEIAAYEHDAGRRVVGSGPAVADDLVLRALRGSAAKGGGADRLAVAVPVSHDGEIIGVVRVSESRAVTDQRMRIAWAIMLGLAVLAMTGAWLLARSLSRRLARPLEALAQTAGRLGDGDFSVRSPTSSIPEIDAVGLALDNAAARLDDLLARERAFSADASHQLRTPLTGLRFALEAALHQPGKRDQAIRVALADADRLEQTIHELLTLARQSAPNRVPVDLAHLLDDARTTWEARFTAAGRALDVLVEHPIPLTVASLAAVRQVLDVLVDNALAHGDGGVVVTAREAGDALAIDVLDHGRSIPSDDDLFRRRPSPATGHGIGLALARRLAEAEGGRLSLTHRAPTTFTLLLPTPKNATPDLTPSHQHDYR